LRAEQRSVFLEKLGDAVIGSGVRPFHVTVTGLAWVPNSQRTRWFLVLGLKRPGNDGLNHLLALTNCIARDLRLEMLYADEEAKGDVSSEGGPHDGEVPIGGKELKSRKHGRSAAKSPVDCTSKFHLNIAWQVATAGACKGAD
jgi:hypothetical protein